MGILYTKRGYSVKGLLIKVIGFVSFKGTPIQLEEGRGGAYVGKQIPVAKFD